MLPPDYRRHFGAVIAFLMVKEVSPQQMIIEKHLSLF
jgi:hypothetical protein